MHAETNTLDVLIIAHQAAIDRWRDEPGWTSFVLRLMEAWIADEREGGAMNHKQMNARLAALCRELGIYCWINAGEHLQHHGTGWVDAVTIGSIGALFIENKTEDGRRTRAQIRVANLIERAGLQYRLYRPSDYEDDHLSFSVRNDLESIA